METITISAKGQIVIPSRIRKKFGLKKGEKLAIIEEDGCIKILPPTDITTLCGTWSDLDPKAVRKQIEEMRREDRY
ncbi:looped-hinge helix DNA binding domain, AbrB family [Candidatus Methanoperedens nitroreducens]|uniref:Looped-hinge helix DNA binding domain, AbrB family n=1 Tax=Candidatus Methanoperedens nitratireducens TaxID=1392998 RepID=A0A062V8U5_9EURY|nr:AbrB/MazE/SpoVT family DNA-binding domain-containing protein [Candidatus Methanoperedens nitroreducens]KCZ72928.1 looped-hinge helix DNA binding domain, AbrB family [Candidatus Methanoperedens nitroreducens]MDJ1423144.1 AbrB/MazE/SpoVT family DNA-binding domain-containing protein [Candidatus Methanoperedens sp.]